MIDFRDKNKMLTLAAKHFPHMCILGGIHQDTRRYGLFVYKPESASTNLPAIGAEPVLFVEVAGSSDEDMQVVLAKIALVCG